MIKKGKLIIIEGSCDGVGKTTQYNKLIERLKRENEKIVTHHFPSYNKYQALPVEKYLNGEYGDFNDLSPYFINSLYANDRGITWNTLLKKEYEAGKTIILDRYTTSSLIYQSSVIDNPDEIIEFVDFITDYEYNKIGIAKPDLVIFLHIPFSLSLKLIKSRTNNDGVANDIHETNIEFMKKVYTHSLLIADYLNWERIKCNDNDQMRSKDSIHEDIYKLVKSIK